MPLFVAKGIAVKCEELTARNCGSRCSSQFQTCLKISLNDTK